MGKYLDIARKFEARMQAEGRLPSQRPAPSPPADCAQQGEVFLERHLPPAAQATFPDWEGLLIKSAVLDLSVWVVRSRQEGEELARETGHPALLLDAVLSQKGKTPAAARESLLPLLIVGTVQ